MNKLILILFFMLVGISCKKDATSLPTPGDIDNLTVEPKVGAVLLRWTVPADSNFLYMQIRYKKGNRTLITNASKYASSMEIDGLLNRVEYTFELQTYNADGTNKAAGKVQLSPPVSPLRRPIEETDVRYDVSLSMLGCYPVEIDEGGGAGILAKLIDGDRTSYFLTDWRNPYERPYWISLTFNEPQPLSEIRYYFRNNSSLAGRPTAIALETSEDGQVWQEVYVANDLNVNVANNIEQKMKFDNTYTSKYFRFNMKGIYGNADYFTFGEMSFYHTETVDKEQEAEENYE